MSSQAARFLTAEWRYLAMLNYEIEPAILAPAVPDGTELDTWDGKTFVSLVGFRFLRTRVGGWPIPFHRNFDEVNLRFYVRRQTAGGWRRGVVFLKEIVPHRAIAFVARNVYHEPYVALPMTSRIDGEPGQVRAVQYRWQTGTRQNRLSLSTHGSAQPLTAGSMAEFITEHYWGYNRQRDGTTLEYRVDHPPWRVYDSAKAQLDCDVAGLYGTSFVDCLAGAPASAFLAEGSAVVVYRGGPLTA